MQCGMFSLFLSFFKNYFLVVIKHLESVNFVFLQNWEVFSPFLLYTYIYVKYYIYIPPPAPLWDSKIQSVRFFMYFSADTIMLEVSVTSRDPVWSLWLALYVNNNTEL